MTIEITLANEQDFNNIESSDGDSHVRRVEICKGVDV